jgi:hypothetical protein
MAPRFVFTLATRHVFRRRSIGFLEELERGELDAQMHFVSLRDNELRTVQSRFDYWLQRAGPYPKYFHGWSTPDYKRCFVFKWEKKHKPQRLYGFLCHPVPESDPSFELCTLVYYSTKDEATNYTLLDRINTLRQDLCVTEAIAHVYPEYGGKAPWKN